MYWLVSQCCNKIIGDSKQLKGGGQMDPPWKHGGYREVIIARGSQSFGDAPTMRVPSNHCLSFGMFVCPVFLQRHVSPLGYP